MRDFIKVRLVPAQETALICICCFEFNTEYAIQPNDLGIRPVAGIHKRCIDLMHVQRSTE